jgi:hypothetical protein
VPTEWAQAKAREFLKWLGDNRVTLYQNPGFDPTDRLAALLDSVRTYCPECGSPGECACLGNLRADVERLRNLIIRANEEICDTDYEFGTCNGCGEETATASRTHKPDCIFFALAAAAKDEPRK